MKESKKIEAAFLTKKSRFLFKIFLEGAMSNKSKVIFFPAVFFVLSLCALGQTDVWTPCGPEGADMSGLVIDPGNSSILYAATKSGGVYKSINGAAIWNAINEGLPFLSIDGIVINPKTPSILYVWSGTYGVCKTTDGGSTWTLTGLSEPVYSLAIDPQTPDNLYVVLWSNISMKSTDGGTTWAEIAVGFPDARFYVVDPGNSSVVFFEDYELGLYKSTDGGVSWSPTDLAAGADPVTNPPKDIIPHQGAVAIDAHNSLIIYAGGWNNGDLWKSIDGGANFTSIASFGSILGRVWLDSNSSATIYASYGSLIKSTDGGQTWVDPLGTGQPPSVSFLALNPISSLILYIGADFMGVYKSVDGGDSWQASNTNMRAIPVYKLAIDPQDESTIYAGTLGMGIYKSLDAGASWDKYNNGIPETSYKINSLAINPQNTSVVYAGTQEKIYNAGPTSKGGIYRTGNNGASWTAINTGLPRGKDSTWVVVVDPQNPSTVYAGSNESIYKSIDGGGNWTDIKGSLIYRIAAIAVDPQTSTTLYIGANSMKNTTSYGVFKSSDGGATWAQTGLGQQDIRAMAVDPLTPSIVYAVTMRNGIYKSTNSGANWGQINSGISGAPNSSFIIDQESPATLYVGTDQGGIFKSENGGANWTSIKINLVASRIWSLCLSRQEPEGITLLTRTSGSFGQGVLSKNGLPVAEQETGRLYSSAQADGSIFYLDLEPPSFTLTIMAGAGGTTNPVPGTYTYDAGAVISVTATASAGYRFGSWSGDATGTTNPVSITMNGNKTVTANFIRQQYTLTVDAGTGGTTNPVPGTYTYDEGAAVSVTATASAGYRFGSWSGDATGTTNPVSITMNGNKAVTANFIRQYTLTVAAGAGGTTNPVPGTYTYDAGTVISVTATASAGYRFGSWSGAATGTTNPVSITMNGNKTVTANFIRQYTLTVAAGAGGTTNPVPGTYTYDAGTVISVTATASAGYRFGSWSGDATGSTNPVNVTMNSDKTVTANFIRQYTLTIAATVGGTTNPVPGAYTYDEGTSVSVQAIPATAYELDSWTGDASGSASPVTIVMNGNKTVQANFTRAVKPPLGLTGEKLANRSVSMVEYVVRLRWQPNAANAGAIGYRIYQIENGQATVIVDVGAGTYEYIVRRLQATQAYRFGVTAVNGQGWESNMVEVVVQ